jgi:hypothetical protein
MTLEELIEYFKQQHQLVPTMVSAGMSVIYSPHFMRQASKAQDMKRKYVHLSRLFVETIISYENRICCLLTRISDLFETVTNSKIPAHVCSLTLDMLCEDLEGQDVEDVPYIKYTFRSTTH